jgi:hypothetical protein
MGGGSSDLPTHLYEVRGLVELGQARLHLLAEALLHAPPGLLQLCEAQEAVRVVRRLCSCMHVCVCVVRCVPQEAPKPSQHLLRRICGAHATDLHGGVLGDEEARAVGQHLRHLQYPLVPCATPRRGWHGRLVSVCRAHSRRTHAG